MCPLRLILIFLSATLAGFFVFRNLRSQPQIEDDDNIVPPQSTSDSSNPSSNGNSKVDPFPPLVSIFIKMLLF
ncbi:hypothetical protein TanjilG_01442 [Lupinus angustifolius]|uniref:Uncharacterized protein n=1 Tax=Lupinus angustifolius TaxID=3871 RepID=A0A4P1QV92_LUPAN|nr:hypothetical protein TanjilG_01442 [Lupinus angustifolius]